MSPLSPVTEHTPTPWRVETVYSSTSGEPVELSIQVDNFEIAMIGTCYTHPFRALFGRLELVKAL